MICPRRPDDDALSGRSRQNLIQFCTFRLIRRKALQCHITNFSDDHINQEDSANDETDTKQYFLSPSHNKSKLEINKLPAVQNPEQKDIRD